MLVIGVALGSLVTYKFFPQSPFPASVLGASTLQREKEPNDTFTNATPIIFGKEMDGSFGSPGDIDTYTFQTTDAARIRIELQNVPQDYTMNIFDGDNHRIATSSRTGFDDSTSTFTVPAAGNYYIQFRQSGTSFFQSPYTMTVSELEVSSD